MKIVSRWDELKLKKEDYFRLPFIGKKIMVLPSPGIEGSFIGEWCKVIDETRHSFVILCSDGKKRRILKKGKWFKFEIYGKIIKIYGDILIGRPEERIKKRLPKPHKVLW